MRGSGTKIGRRHERAITALLTSSTVTEAAAKCAIGESTLWRWFRDAAFSSEYRRARTQMLESTINTLRNESAGAVSVLTAIARDEKASAAARVSAARSILELSLRSAEIQDLEERLTALEEREAQSK